MMKLPFGLKNGELRKFRLVEDPPGADDDAPAIIGKLMGEAGPFQSVILPNYLGGSTEPVFRILDSPHASAASDQIFILLFPYPHRRLEHTPLSVFKRRAMVHRFIFGLLALPFAPETQGKPLPE